MTEEETDDNKMPQQLQWLTNKISGTGSRSTLRPRWATLYAGLGEIRKGGESMGSTAADVSFHRQFGLLCVRLFGFSILLLALLTLGCGVPSAVSPGSPSETAP